jgi:hypothetical protein
VPSGIRFDLAKRNGSPRSVVHVILMTSLAPRGMGHPPTRRPGGRFECR